VELDDGGGGGVLGMVVGRGTRRASEGERGSCEISYRLLRVSWRISQNALISITPPPKFWCI